MDKLSIIIPVYNEQDNIENLVFDIIDTQAKVEQLEIVIVDDCSTDNTQNVCANLCQQYSQLTYIRHRKNAGQSAAVYSGIKHSKHPIIVTLDGDGQNPPGEINKLISAYQNTYNNQEKALFAGHRQNRKDSRTKLISSKVANRIRQTLLKDDCPDSGCGLKLFHKTTFLELPHFNHMHRFLPALYKRNGFQVINVPINHQAREFGTSKYNTWGRLKVGIIDLFGVAWLARRPCNPEISETIIKTQKRTTPEASTLHEQ